MENSKVSFKDKLREFRIKDWIYITIGAFLVALASNLFYDKFDLVTGGVIGIGIILKKFFEIPLWLTNIALNVPLFLIAIMVKGKQIGIKSLYGTLILTIALYVTNIDFMPTNDLLLATIYGGAISGAGIGLVFSGFGTTGGTDLIAIIIKHFIPYISIGNALRTIEIIIVSLGALVFGVDKALLAIVAIYVSTKVMDAIVNGMKFGKTVYIISDKYEVISNEIMNSLVRGVTALEGTGMYSNNAKKVLFCVVTVKQLPLLKKIVYEIDENAFMFINDAREVLGNGFHSSKEEI